MFETFNDIAQATDHDLLVCIAYFTGGLLIMRVCQWVYVVCKWLYDWLYSLFPTTIDIK